MKLYKIGKVVSQKKKYIIFESNYQGETIYVSTFNKYEIDKVTKLFVYEYKSEYTQDMYGFKTFNERYLFMDLISLTGVGPKTALLILNKDFEKIAMWIAHGEIDQLNQLPYIGNKLARQIVFELQEKYSYFYKNSNKNIEDEPKIDNKATDLKITLKTLGFQKGQIDLAMNEIDNLNVPLEQLVEESITLISNAK